MLKKTAPTAIFFVIIIIMGIVSQSIYFYSLPLAETTDILFDSPIRYEYTVTGTAQETAPRQEIIYMPFTGKIINLYVAAGQKVKTGDLLFSVDVSALIDEIEQTEKLIEEKNERMAQTNDRFLKERLSAQIELLESRLNEKNECLVNDIVFSPFNGVVSKVNQKNGDKTAAASAVVEITVYTAALKTFLSFSNNYRHFETGEAITLKNSRNRDCVGIIRDISFTGGQKHLEIELGPSTISIYKGEPLRFSDSYTTEDIARAVKTDAVRIDKDGYYVLQLIKEQTSLGEKMFAKRTNIYIGVTVGEYTEITGGIKFSYPVITNPEIGDGMEVRVY